MNHLKRLATPVSPATSRAALASLAYLFVSLVWVWGSDRIAEQWLSSAGLRWNVQTVKGFLFVTATAVYLFFLSRSFAGRAAASHSQPECTLGGRTVLIRRLGDLLAARRGGTLLVLDVDGMRLVNESLGHDAGDALMQSVAAALVSCAPPQGVPFRLDGDEFALLLPEVDPEGGYELALELQRRLGSLDRQAGQRGRVSFCSGLVPLRPGMEPQDVLLVGQLLLHRAQQWGQGRILPPPDDAELAALHAMARWGKRLSAALRNGSLFLEYQPVVHLERGGVAYAEALLRLRDEDGETYPAGTFLNAAEEFRLMPEVDRWCLEQVIATLEGMPDLHLFINLSGQSLRDPAQRRWMARRVEQARAVAHRLTFEITETAWAGDAETLRAWMDEMRALGCGFALDDLGQGFSSLSALANLPVNVVKIDGSFVTGLAQNPASRLVVEAIHRLATDLGLQVVAEWVEDEDTRLRLCEIGVELGQGFHLGRPGPLSALVESLNPAAS